MVSSPTAAASPSGTAHAAAMAVTVEGGTDVRPGCWCEMAMTVPQSDVSLGVCDGRGGEGNTRSG